MAFPRKDPSTQPRRDDPSGPSSPHARPAGAPEDRGPKKVDRTLGSHATAERGATHPDRRTEGGRLHGSVTPGDRSGRPAEKATEESAPGSNAVSQPNRDDVHEQRSDAQAREGTVEPTLPRHAKP